MNSRLGNEVYHQKKNKVKVYVKSFNYLYA